MCSLKAKVARHSGRLEVLHSIWPDLQMLKQLGQEVQEAKVKMNRIEKAVKGLQREVEEGEHRSMGELVLELREGPGGAGGGISPERGGAAGGEAC